MIIDEMMYSFFKFNSILNPVELFGTDITDDYMYI
jgi:hypothetical protein